VTVELAVVGAPFLDLTFEGLERLPHIGEELLARALHVAPGGTGMQAIGAARLGLSTALVAPIGTGGAASLLAETFQSEGVTIAGDQTRSGALPVTALLATSEGVAMASVAEATEPTADDVADASALAVALSFGRLRLAPPGISVYAVTGGLELGAITDEMMARLGSAHALIVNASEAAALTGHADPREAAAALTHHVRTAIVTMGADGALAAQGDAVTSASAPAVDVVDATGAGDLFVAAYIWAELRGADLKERLAWASLYAGLSTRAPTALAGALHLDDLLAEGITRGLQLPPDVSAR
jgi:sugar/nucleoside kinase (ribokinase family)